MGLLLPEKEKKKVRFRPPYRKDNRKHELYICGKEQKCGLFQYHQCFCVALMRQRIDRQRGI